MILPSTIAEVAFSKPILIALRTVLPAAISSRIRAYMITLASTAIPIFKMIPAIPGSVNVKSNPFNANNISSTYVINASTAAIPGTLYTAIRNNIIMINPIMPA